MKSLLAILGFLAVIVMIRLYSAHVARRERDRRIRALHERIDADHARAVAQDEHDPERAHMLNECRVIAHNIVDLLE